VAAFAAQSKNGYRNLFASMTPPKGIIRQADFFSVGIVS